jgi:hypothetical protein
VRWEWIAVVYAAYLAVVAWTRGYPTALRLGTAAAAGCAWLLTRLPPPAGSWQTAVHACLPVAVLLGGYRLSGLFFVAPMEALEARLLAIDRRVFDAFGATAAAAARAPLARAALELAYLLVYPMVPLGAVTLYAAGAAEQLPRYWTVVLTACFSSYAALPWLQTRPPRALEGFAPQRQDERGDRAPLRRLNLAILRHGSNRVNTLPSGHVAAALAVALTVSGSAGAAGLAFFALTAAIAVATVVGRYHYTVDTAAGLAVALASWWWMS